MSRRFRVVADEPRAVGELHDRPHLVKARRLHVPADPREAREIDVARLVAEREPARRRAEPGPDMRRVVLVAVDARELDLLGRRAVELELDAAARDARGRDRMLAAARDLLPIFLEEQWRPGHARPFAGRRRGRGLRGPRACTRGPRCLRARGRRNSRG